MPEKSRLEWLIDVDEDRVTLYMHHRDGSFEHWSETEHGGNERTAGFIADGYRYRYLKEGAIEVNAKGEPIK